jgi:hypothetical protein
MAAWSCQAGGDEEIAILLLVSQQFQFVLPFSCSFRWW